MSSLPQQFAFGEAVGWRAWTVIGSPSNPRLYSQYGHLAEGGKLIVKAMIWPTQKWMVARCPKAPTDPFEAVSWYAVHETPNANCSCGIYAARDRDHLLDLTAQAVAYQAYTRDRLAVIGTVGLAGKVIEHVNGFKGEKARPTELYVPAARWDYASGLEDAYGIPVVLDNTWERVVSDHGTRIGG